MSNIRTPAKDKRAWRNADYSYVVVQALPETGKGASDTELLRGYPCECRLHCDPPEHIARWVFLERTEARHLLRYHIVRANQGLLRFSSKLRAQYACDLEFEIDAHVDLRGFLDYQAYEPIIRTATAVGRRIYDYLVDTLEVDPRFITTTVTRMGARVTVDWRAFGPQVLHDLLIVTRYIEERAVTDLDEIEHRLMNEAQVEATRLASELSELEIPTPLPTSFRVKVDTGIYKKSDRPRLDSEGNIAWAGPFLRPIGTLHSATDNTTMYVRSVPVPHDRFRPENAEWLVRVSRSAKPDVETFAEPELFEVAHRYPASRDPAFDHLIEEADIPVAAKLIAVFEASDGLVDELSDEHRAEVRNARPRLGGGVLTRKDGVTSEVSPEVVERVIAAIPKLEVKRHGDGQYRVDCPYCGRSDSSAALYIGSGRFTCFRCHPDGVPLAVLARDHGVGHLVPTTHRSSAASRLVDPEEVPPADPCQSWGCEVVAPEFSSVAELREDMAARIRDFVAGEGSNEILILGPGTGTGKTTTTLRELAACGKQVFGAFPRDDNKPPMLDLIPASRLLTGRRYGQNCMNPDAEDAAKRRVPSGEFCGPKVCDFAEGCAYLAQFQDAEGVSFAGHHAHLPLLANESFTRFLNDSDVVFIDENSFGQVVENIDLTTDKLDDFRCVEGLAFQDGADSDCFSFDDAELMHTAPTPAIERIISGLERALGGDRVLETKLDEVDRAEGGKRHVELHRTVLADGPLTRHMVEDDDLVQAIHDFDLDDARAFVRSMRPSSEPPCSPEVEPEPVPEIELTPEILAACEPAPPRVKVDQVHSPSPIRVLSELVEALTDVVTGAPTTPVSLVRGKKGWVLRLTLRRRFAVPNAKIILASASVRPEQVRLMFGDAKVTVYAPKVKDPKTVTIVADHTYSQRQFEKSDGPRSRVFETVKAHIASEFRRTGLPVAVIGTGNVMNMFNAFMLGEKAVRDLTYPFSQSARSQKKEDLRRLTLEHHYLSGYSRAVEGSNDFGVEENGRFRFVRSLVVLGSLLPPVGEVEATFRGVYAGDEHYVTEDFPGIGPLAHPTRTTVDWTPVHRIVPFDGQVVEGKPLAATQVIGFADARANEILHASYEAVLLQVLGRLRSVVPDPIDPTIEPRVLVVGAVSVPGLHVDRVVSLEQVREELGMDVVRGKGRGASPGRPRSWEPTIEKIRADVAKRGRANTILRVADHYQGLGLGRAEVLTNTRLAFQLAGLEWTGKDTLIMADRAKSNDNE
jgi:hypothetical protein